MTTVEFDSNADFTAAMTAQTGTSGGRWRHDNNGSSASSNTGPGTNNGSPFQHTEASSMGSTTAGITNGTAVFIAVPNGMGRTLRLRMCLQGSGFHVDAGMDVQSRVDGSGTWATVGDRIYSWAYSDSNEEGDTITDRQSNSLTCVQDGGWVDFERDIPDGHSQVRLRPHYEDPGFQQDMAWREFEWTMAQALGPKGGYAGFQLASEYDRRRR